MFRIMVSQRLRSLGFAVSRSIVCAIGSARPDPYVPGVSSVRSKKIYVG
jgi:hypothetical protein